MSKRDADILFFVAFCLEGYKNKHGLTGKVAAVASFIAEDENISPLDALSKFYESDTYRRLEQEDTKYWHYGPVALYQDYQLAL